MRYFSNPKILKLDLQLNQTLPGIVFVFIKNAI